MAQLRVPDPGRVQEHQHRAMGQAVRGGDQAGDLLVAQDLGQAPRDLGIRRVIEPVAALQNLVEEEADGTHVELDGAWCQLPLTKQVRLVGPKMGVSEAVGRAFEVPRKLLNVLHVVRDRRRGIVATVELVQHRLTKMGHKTPPVTHTLPG